MFNLKNEILNFTINFPFIGGIVTFLAGFVLMPFVLNFAQKHNLVVRPNKRTSHNGSVPNIGGLDIFLSLIFVFIFMLIFNKLHIAFFIGFCLLFLIGFIDDRLVLSAYWKILGETLCAFFLIYFADIRITSFYGVFGVYELPLILSYAVSYIVFLVIINALNLIDGVDGLASGLGILYCLFFGIWFYIVHLTYYSLFCFALIGSLSVFFLYNVFGKSKRKIFMGDSGALILGYLITFIVFVFLEKNSKGVGNELLNFKYAPATVFCILFVPVFDIVRVAITRLKQHKSLLEPDKNHIHHLLLYLGLSHKQVTLVLVSVSSLFMLTAILLKDYNIWVQLSIILVMGILMIFLLWQLIDGKNQKTAVKKQNPQK